MNSRRAEDDPRTLHGVRGLVFVAYGIRIADELGKQDCVTGVSLCEASDGTWAHLLDDEFLHLNTANRAHQHRIQNIPKNVFVEVHHWIALSSMGDSMRHFLWADDQMIGLSRTSIRED